MGFKLFALSKPPSLAQVNVKKLGVAGGAFLLADVISGLVMGRSFFKIIGGNAGVASSRCSSLSLSHNLAHSLSRVPSLTLHLITTRRSRGLEDESSG